MNNESAPTKSQTALHEEKTIGFWRDIDAFKKTIEKDAPKGEYIFFDGPPFATGTPHYGHLLASAIKDAIPRYKTMNGFRVLRRWGWDCHGLPIENIVEKELNISGKKQIEELGLEKFNEHARSKVMTYASEWKKTIERMARWVEFDNSYKTMDNTFIESVWWGLKQLHEQGKIYEHVKVLMYCPRCETPLSNAEVTMDNSYKDITDISIYVKFKLVGEENTYIIAWTTTPWTLPGNTALAVGEDISYIKVKIKKSKTENTAQNFDVNAVYILAKERVQDVLKNYEYEVVGEMKGGELVGKSYEPVFDYYKNLPVEAVQSGTSFSAGIKNKENGWKIYAGDFVTTTDGTGVVHIAPAFGEDDLRLANKEKLPIIHHVDTTGRFKSEVVDFAGQLVKPKDTKEEPVKHQTVDIEIIKWLAHNGKLFEKQKIVHSYPHCYRCETPLFYYAIPAWFIEIQASKEKFLKLNEKITWIPGHLKEGRFKNVMENAPDWNISRNRFWATPLPFWKCSSCSKLEVLGSIEELRSKSPKGIASLTLMRHGESEKNIKGVFDDSINGYALTENGRKQALEAVEELRSKNIKYVYCSPVRRTRETAEIVANALGLEVVVKEELKEIDSGDWDGKEMNSPELKDEISHYDGLSLEEYYAAKRGTCGEAWKDMDERVLSFTQKILNEHDGENVLFVTHQGPLVYIAKNLHSITLDKMEDFYQQGEFQKYAHPISYYVDTRRGKVFDMHRPYTDNFVWTCTCGGEYKRVPEVIDCWFESASMPYASQHYPFENKEFFKTHFPADFIAEYIAQTRTWFYYTHAVSSVLFGDIAFKNVVTTGTVLAEDGQKMSKSKNNFPDPWIMFNKYGADAVRFYLLSSPLMRSEDLNFAEREVDEIHKKIVLRMRNVLSFYEMYKREGVELRDDSKNVLDRWIVARLRQVCAEVTSGMEVYEIDRALKSLMPFVDDLSTWYLRRSRDRMKEEGEDALVATSTLRYVVFRFAQIIAPFMPFLAEELYQGVRSDKDEMSVHFTQWPHMSESVGEKVKHIFAKDTIIEDMAKVREIVSLALEARAAAGIKIKQPLAMLAVHDPDSKLSSDEYAVLIRDEINVKTVVGEPNREETVWLDTHITPELKEEGDYRELLRTVQELRKKKNLKSQDKIILSISTDEIGKQLVEKFKAGFTKTAGVVEIVFPASLEVEKIKIGECEFGVEVSLKV